jgi:GTP-binding nuclear protein Ran
MMNNQITCAIVGAPNSGKTTFINRHVTGQFRNTYLGDTIKLVWNTSNGKYTLNITDALLVFFDTQDMTSFTQAEKLVLEARNGFGEHIPIILCGNKCDISHDYPKQMLERINTLRLQQHIVIFMISAKSNYNYEKPFLTAIRKVTNDNNITLVEEHLLEQATMMVQDDDIDDSDYSD